MVFRTEERVKIMSEHIRTIITIARQYGSGGREIGEMLAKKLDVPYYDKELIALAAKESGFSEEMFRRADERAASSLLYSLVMGNYGFGSGFSTMNEMHINDKLFLIQADIIRKAAERGSCVIVGRCADYVLGDYSSCIHVFIHAFKEDRIRRISRIYKLNEKQAWDKIKRTDRERRLYYETHAQRPWGSIESHQILFNASLMGVDGIVDALEAMYRTRHK